MTKPIWEEEPNELCPNCGNISVVHRESVSPASGFVREDGLLDFHYSSHYSDCDICGQKAYDRHKKIKENLRARKN